MKPAIHTAVTLFGGVDAPLVEAQAGGIAVLYTVYDHAKTDEQNQLNAATVLCQREGWSGTLVGGKAGVGIVWVFADLEQLSHYVPEAPDGWQCVGTDHD